MQKEYQFKDPKTTVLIEDDSVVFRRGTNDLMIHKMMRGDTKVFYNQITAIKYKEPSLGSKGYLQLTTPRTSILGMARTVDQPQNAIKFKKDKLADAKEIKDYIEAKIAQNKNAATAGNESEGKSPVEQVKELKELLDMDILTQEEFDKKKKELLGL
ncbi:SHOCT domain-containing protein [Neobacillus sp. YX16]|uniref:SHOCT domain-containing protein n=1 Tax=Neobacillus sp. YX16 TaxID=3047874 RepID=UPI0024C3980A|nr:SHOCT domain-containing protein [Neobacillus sp. YX16]WHZ05778.1 SHOCT domain-containing protein [Neobacillus sp. YX16]